MKKPVKLFWFILVFSLCFTYSNIFGQLRNISTIDDSWKFKLYDDPNSSRLNFDDSNWETVTLPHTWNNYDGQDGGANYYRGAGWYRKSFHLNNVSGKCIFLKFNSANLKTEVYINGTLAGTHIGGYSAFIFNITNYVIQGSDNLIAVKVSNDASLKFAPLAGDFTFYGGITKSVELWVTGNVLVSPLDYASPGVYITPENISESHADINVKVLLANYSTMNAPITENYTIKDEHNTIVNSLSVNNSLSPQTERIVSHNLSINNPVLWQGLKNPYLYTLEISLTVNGNEVDRLTQKFGVRYLGSLPDSGIYLNGKRYPLNGVAFHEDRKNKGRAISDIDRKQDLEVLKETGLNYLRLAHYQHGQFTYNYCDSAGIILWTEIPLLEKIDNSNSAFSDNIKEQLKELIKQNYNHPSVCFWGLFNEIQTQTDSPDALQVVTEVNSLAKSLDNTRYTVAATNMDIPSNSIPDLISWNLYYGWYYLQIPDFSSSLDNKHKYNPDMIIGVSEYGAGASINDHEENPAKPIIVSNYHPEEYQNYFHEEHWKYIKQKPFIWESSIWVGFDFASDARNEGDDKGINDKGLITHDRLVKKDAYFFYKANWSSSPVVYITSRRYNERTEPITSVKVYSNSDSVKLLVNSTSYGYLKSSDHIFIRNIILADGPNMIKALGIKNGQITRDSCVWYLNSTPDEIIRINFEANSTITPSGYIADKGNVYGDRGNGLTYGWNEDNTTNARERFLATDKAFDTFIHLQTGNKEYSWEIAVKNGTYAIYVACGDPAYFDSHHKLMIENKTVIDFIPNANSPWQTANDTVAVSDGKLTVHAAGGGINTKINFIHLTLINSVNLVPNISAAPNPAAFGSVNIDSYSDITIVVNNSGTANLNVTGASLSGTGMAQFSIQSGAGATTIPAGANSNIVVRFIPSAVGAVTTSLVIASNDPDAANYTVNLTGTGTCIQPSAPTIGTIIQPTCLVATGSVDLGGLPATGTWTLKRSPGGTTYSNTGTSYSVTGLPAGTTYTFTVTSSFGCVSAASNGVNINIQPATPAQPGSISGNATVCQGTSQTYSISAVTGATSYTWTLPSGWSGSSSTTSITATAGAGNGNISVAANNACGSGSARTLGVSVTPTPAQPGSISGNATVCQGSSQTYSISAVTGATSYTWTLPSGWSGSSATTSITATAGAGNGNISVAANNTCGSGSARTLGVSVTPTPAQPGSITGNATVCQGSSQTYSISAVTGATSYTWTLPSGWSGSSATTSITATAGAGNGNISVTANNTCGSGSARTMGVSVTPTPAQPGSITGNATVCQGSSQTYSISAVTGATSYTWTLPSGWSGSSSTTSITATAGAGSGNISVTANNACGSGSIRTLGVSANPTPTAPNVGNITQPIDAETTGSVVLSGLPPSGNWTLTRSPGGTITSGAGISVTISGLPSGTFTFTVTNESGCVSEASIDIVINAVPIITGQNDLTIAEDNSITITAGDLLIADSDNTPAQMTINVSHGNNYSVSNGNTITPATNFNGTLTVPVTVNDGIAGSNIFDAIVTITPVNDRPQITEIPDQEITQDSVFSTFNLDDFIEDVETRDEFIVWTYSGNTKIKISVLDHIVTLSRFDEDWIGSDTIVFEAIDDDALNPLSASDAVIFTVKNSKINGLYTNESIHMIGYPNPAKEWIALLFDNQPNKDIRVEIFTSQGRFVSSIKTSIIDGQIYLDIHDLSSGAYFVRIVAPEFTKTFKIIKKQ